MVVSNLLDRLRGGADGQGEKSSTEKPTHECQSCGEEYVARPGEDIAKCHSCGGVKVEPI